MCGALNQTLGASTAVGHSGLSIRWKGKGGEQLTNEEATAIAWMDQHGVFAYKAEPCARAEVSFLDCTGIDVSFCAPSEVLFEPLGDGFEFCIDVFVVVFSPCVARDDTASGIALVFWELSRPVLEGKEYQALDAG